ncbi:DUF2649 domain-containing protein [Spiroplasma citri]|uniref:Plectrovirus spv1-r8a2b orf 10 c-terminal truncated protein n=1 Tax=Spiroplasma citri TaxID=2133 RepID=Q14L88_SPICI|nr:DUF2649 domain-containing protein [Spiroplasma citri]CAK99742.1 plectrovirus spv1-r8a2b orf 10 c-terminal truncated protein [Spiroplasma citri]
MQNDWIKLKKFFIHIFLFIDKKNVESITMWNLTQNEYLTLMVGDLNCDFVFNLVFLVNGF